MSATTAATSLAIERLAAGMTQEQLAERLGLTAQAVSQWETGQTAPSGSSRMLLAQIFGVDAVAIESWFARAEVA